MQCISELLLHVLDELTKNSSALYAQLLVIVQKIDFRFREFHRSRIEHKEFGRSHAKRLTDPVNRVVVGVVLLFENVL